MLDAEDTLWDWCENKGYDYEKIPTELRQKTESLFDDSLDMYINHHKNDILDDCSFILEQEFSEHPEWKLKEEPKSS